MEAGPAYPLLIEPTPLLNYLTPCWIISIRNFLRKNQIQVTLTDSWIFRLPRKNNKFLMDIFRESKTFSNQERRQLNIVRIYLQVATVSDISTAVGNHITEKAFQASRNFHQRSRYKWIRQLEITDQ